MSITKVQNCMCRANPGLIQYGPLTEQHLARPLPFLPPPLDPALQLFACDADDLSLGDDFKASFRSRADR
jgi:hypothetical protein